ncbi:hypothetical protein [Futiania mangrovi]|uniref:Uncharacterized protein n=1 Tax=Futiania mangrovi TaxID=2959716 RepID=A0A9J6P8Y9_9PROT|nr:hypothetical protein [Futiania mangrovii]MCP1335157.1 hypothetical protein [Futiania mangrovii]
MMAALDDQTRDRLAKLLGMLGSDHDGERAAAGLKADRLVKKIGASWYDILKPQETTRAADPVWRDPRDWREALALCLRYSEWLNDWEDEFCRSVWKRRTITERQEFYVWTALEKVRAAVTTGGGDA